jgi:hypothetical protein
LAGCWPADAPPPAAPYPLRTTPAGSGGRGAQLDNLGWFKKAVGSTEELDYAEALDWFGLRFAPGDGGAKTWRLELREDATAAQRGRLKAWLEPAGK